MKASALWKRWPGSFSSARITTASSAGETCGLIELGRCGVLRDLLHRDRDGASRPRRGPGRSAPRRGSRRSSRGRRPAVTSCALGLLGREVVRGAHHRAGLGDLRDAGAGDAEVGDGRLALVVDDHVLRLQVAVDDAVAVGEAGAPRAPGGSGRPTAPASGPGRSAPSASAPRGTASRCSRCRRRRRGRRRRRCWGAARPAAASASRRKRSTNSRSWAKRPCRTLSATWRCRCVSSASQTSAIPPEPIRRSSR